MIIIDYRERGSGVPEELAKLGVPIQFDNLNVGDYLIACSSCVERKSANDFISSVIDKRLFEQAQRLAAAYEKPILVVEGIFSEALRFRKIGYPQVYGALAAVVGMGITILFTIDHVDTAQAIRHLYELSAENSAGLVAERPPMKIVERSGRTIEVVQLNMVASIPGIDRELARRILLHFSTPRRFFKAAPSELRRVEGLGRARIARIIEVLDTVHYPAERDEER